MADLLAERVIGMDGILHWLSLLMLF